MSSGFSMTLQPRDTLLPRRPEGMGRGLMLAIAVHIALVIALAIGVHWKSREPESMSAELWSALPQTAAPRAVEPEPPPPPPPQPKPVPPAPPPPKVAAPPPPQPDADIAIEKARRQKETEERAHEQQEAAHREREEKKRQEAEKRVAAEKRAAEKAAAEREAAKERERQQQAEAEAQKKKQLEEKREAARVAARLEAIRKDQMARIMGQANATGDERSSGRALQSSGPSAGYAGRIKARIKPNIVFTDDVAGNPEAEVELRLAPDGTILGTPRLIKPSGSKSWDDAVVRAVVKTETLPRDIDGRVPSSMVITFRPRE
jgi:colicin import membrane protein